MRGRKCGTKLVEGLGDGMGRCGSGGVLLRLLLRITPSVAAVQGAVQGTQAVYSLSP